MKKVIRQGCYETNSSSQHVVVVTKNNTHVTPEEINPDYTNDDSPFYEWCYVNKEGLWNIGDVDEGFGRYPFRILTTFKDKMMYAICEYLGHLYEDDPEWQKWYDELKGIAASMIPDFTDFKFHTKEVDIYLDKNGNEIPHNKLIYKCYSNGLPVYTYFDENGEEVDATLNEDEYWESPDIGTIDHQSAGLLKNFLKDKGISLKEFLTNKRYMIVQDGDEYCDFDRLLKSGIINRNFITEIYDESGEDLEWLEWLKEQEAKNEESNT